MAGVQRVVEIDAGQDREDIGLQESDEELERRYGARLWDLDVHWHYPEPGRIRVLDLQRVAP